MFCGYLGREQSPSGNQNSAARLDPWEAIVNRSFGFSFHCFNKRDQTTSYTSYPPHFLENRILSTKEIGKRTVLAPKKAEKSTPFNFFEKILLRDSLA